MTTEEKSVVKTYSDPWSFWRSIGSPKFVVAPMVDQSELPFRLLARKYGADLCYTPMIHSRLFSEQAKYRKENFSTCAEERPVFAQFCGNEPQTLVDAASLLQDQVDAVDLNLGCPQGIAKKGRYGSFLLHETDLLANIVSAMSQNLRVPVTCKIRKVTSPNELQDTMNLVNRLIASGCAALTVHGRTKEQKGQNVGQVDWDTIKIIKQRVGIPVIANGGIETYEDALKCLEYTGCDAVMSSEAVLENPALFSGKKYRIDELMLEYLNLVEKYPAGNSAVKAHLFHSLHSGLMVHTDLREQLGKARSMPEFRAVAVEMKRRRDRPDDITQGKDLGWYRRYRERIGPPKERQKAKRKAEESEEAGQQEGGEAQTTTAAGAGVMQVDSVEGMAVGGAEEGGDAAASPGSDRKKMKIPSCENGEGEAAGQRVEGSGNGTSGGTQAAAAASFS
uniref:tRNA-dihydrouridine(16/17) synthase [NAD(P)(+)] n=1 Tax=Chromera velia CCMP2878 TaxID=1169474 RepID=A0A0G4HY55_9ALVE|mmetsp:Transcript_53439/g.104534  ORF Transcript_53439/g.104534 Transcript_53439/m.104534 type:complete len:449 (+) Transcript_53439:104-1450(+)|eukprot:Cvel_9411.t1-p1 / transcript=Cvel_9411.t1 / gene=Cvel_9411 / organism=Chromera_velia_CCMP2878 / gene_product=tRNA-dihydrouridine(16/17) synthase, putative / transcript_product=tRNA-dihydrouridine(16/17) synthase, putative / location=Cvel_scaffold541:44497-49469(-) / protein_length=448 / sequence_SO=supercontig / SO=protein_coding / is_pseudo=false